MRVLFFGTPDFAVPSLDALVGEGFDVIGVVTVADKPVGRHHSVPQPSPVKRAALAEDLPLFQPADPAAAPFLQQVKDLAPDISVVAAYGRILKPALLGIPRKGSVNVHASLLPRLRGAAPIERAILEGCTETGVTIMQMDAGMDTGPILHQVPTPIPPDETSGELRVRLAEIGALALVEALTLLEETGLTAAPQDEAQATYAPKLTREEERLDWRLPAEVVARRIRAFDPRPGAWTSGRGRAVKLFGGRALEGEGHPGAVPGTVLVAADGLRVAAGSGVVEATEVQPEGKKRMSVQSWVSGRGVVPGEVFE
jgi:methionyl-tRNA formyltransferase